MSGTATRIGAKVANVAARDSVIAVATDGCFSTRAVINSVLCVKIPDELSLEMPLQCRRLSRSILLVVVLDMPPFNCARISERIKIFVTIGSEAKVWYVEKHFGISGDHNFHFRYDIFLRDVLKM
ncbi:hypothetical protein HD806DRAFT_278820 [Xylariaceae sp. AK1471]|nr:hypothetical protein HD806DRAFT_278820 [Xylariaceae sp. AK1471]